MKIVKALIRGKGACLSLECVIAQSMLQRMVGLLKHKSLPEEASLLIVPCNSIHTYFMRFAIDAVFLDRECRVLDIAEALPPSKLRFGKRGCHSVLELPAGRARRVGLDLGDQIEFL